MITTGTTTTTTPPPCTLDCQNGFCKIEIIPGGWREVCQCDHGFGKSLCQQVTPNFSSVSTLFRTAMTMNAARMVTGLKKLNNVPVILDTQFQKARF